MCEGVGARSSTPTVAAGFDADAGSEGGVGAEWQILTRGKARAGTAKKMVMRIRSGVMERQAFNPQ
jgi:hypothetical protein